MKQLDLSRSVFDLAGEFPELIDIMVDLGFSEVSNPAVRASVGRVMTIPKGARMKGIPLDHVVSALRERGFEPVGQGAVSEPASPRASATDAADATEVPCSCGCGGACDGGAGAKQPASSDRVHRLKGYLLRLGQGESLDTVRADFAREFAEVSASEIMDAEQGLMADGVPVDEVTRLCDLHSALFHGAAAGERTDALCDEVPSGAHPGNHPMPGADDAARARALTDTPGHPLNTLSRENRALEEAIGATRAALADGGDVRAALARTREVSIHYAKKGDLLFPLLATRYGIDGPSKVMWTVDDEIRDELAALSKQSAPDPARVEAVLTRAEEMIYKEEHILFPLCAAHFSEAEWEQIYRDSRDYAPCFGVDATWPAADAVSAPSAPDAAPGAALGTSGLTVTMPGGSLTLEQLTALLNTIPAEITFVDAEDVNRFFNEGHKDFKRPAMAIGRDVFSCHPPKVEQMVRAIIDDFRAGRRDAVNRWARKNGKDLYVSYLAVRDASGAYLGTLELVQDMGFAREHFVK